MKTDTCWTVLVKVAAVLVLCLQTVSTDLLGQVIDHLNQPIRDCICNCVNAHDSLIYERKNHGPYPIDRQSISDRR